MLCTGSGLSPGCPSHHTDGTGSGIFSQFLPVVLLSQKVFSPCYTHPPYFYTVCIVLSSSVIMPLCTILSTMNRTIFIAVTSAPAHRPLSHEPHNFYCCFMTFY